MVGNAGGLTQTGTNVNNPHYKQFFSLTEIPKPSLIFVFLDEHPDSINDGYFLVKSDYTYVEWKDLSGSYHDDRPALSFADGDAEFRKWSEPETKEPAAPDAAELPRPIPSDRRADFTGYFNAPVWDDKSGNGRFSHFWLAQRLLNLNYGFNCFDLRCAHHCCAI
ncbi:MAG: hypothetical protein ABIR24_02165 [Verrucomicrobiota bacterium]